MFSSEERISGAIMGGKVRVTVKGEGERGWQARNRGKAGPPAQGENPAGYTAAAAASRRFLRSQNHASQMQIS